MKKTLIYSTVLFLSIALFFTACKKGSSDVTTEIFTESKIHADDHSMVSDQVDEVATDASTSAENVIAISGNGPLNFFPPPCNATITYDTLNAIRKITITYNGLNCAGTRIRTGVVTLSIPVGILWKTAGAQLTVNITNLKITRVSDQKSITINGTKVITNVSGGLLRNLASLGTITHTITSTGMSITFDDGTQRTWQIAKKRIFTYSNGMVISTLGTYSDGTTSGIAEWGTNRFGNSFVTAIIDPMVIRQDCNFRLTSGHLKHLRLLRTVDVTFGLDVNGNPTSCPGLGGTYYMKIVWVNAAGQTVTNILPY